MYYFVDEVQSLDQFLKSDLLNAKKEVLRRRTKACPDTHQSTLSTELIDDIQYNSLHWMLLVSTQYLPIRCSEFSLIALNVVVCVTTMLAHSMVKVFIAFHRQFGWLFNEFVGLHKYLKPILIHTSLFIQTAFLWLLVTLRILFDPLLWK